MDKTYEPRHFFAAHKHKKVGVSELSKVLYFNSSWMLDAHL